MVVVVPTLKHWRTMVERADKFVSPLYHDYNLCDPSGHQLAWFTTSAFLSVVKPKLQPPGLRDKVSALYGQGMAGRRER